MSVNNDDYDDYGTNTSAGSDNVIDTALAGANLVANPKVGSRLLLSVDGHATKSGTQTLKLTVVSNTGALLSSKALEIKFVVDKAPIAITTTSSTSKLTAGSKVNLTLTAKTDGDKTLESYNGSGKITIIEYKAYTAGATATTAPAAAPSVAGWTSKADVTFVKGVATINDVPVMGTDTIALGTSFTLENGTTIYTYVGDLEVKAGDPKTVDVTATSASVITFKLKDSGENVIKGLGNLEVTGFKALDANGGEISLTDLKAKFGVDANSSVTATEADGTYTIASVTAGTYTITFTVKGITKTAKVVVS